MPGTGARGASSSLFDYLLALERRRVKLPPPLFRERKENGGGEGADGTGPETRGGDSRSSRVGKKKKTFLPFSTRREVNEQAERRAGQPSWRRGSLRRRTRDPSACHVKLRMHVRRYPSIPMSERKARAKNNRAGGGH
jgi:hypothetical protein